VICVQAQAASRDEAGVAAAAGSPPRRSLGSRELFSRGDFPPDSPPQLPLGTRPTPIATSSPPVSRGASSLSVSRGGVSPAVSSRRLSAEAAEMAAAAGAAVSAALDSPVAGAALVAGLTSCYSSRSVDDAFARYGGY